MITHRKVDDTECQQDERNLHCGRKPLPDSTENKKERESVHIGTMHM